MIHRFTYKIDHEIVVDLEQEDYQDLIDAGNEDQMETCAYNEAMYRIREMLDIKDDIFNIILTKEKEILTPNP